MPAGLGTCRGRATRRPPRTRPPRARSRGAPPAAVQAPDGRRGAGRLGVAHELAGPDAPVAAGAAEAALVGHDPADAPVLDGLREPLDTPLGLATGEATEAGDLGVGADDRARGASLARDSDGAAAVIGDVA